MKLLLLSDDMLFSSRITATARALDLPVDVARKSTDLLTLTQNETPACVLLDLSNPGLNIQDLLAQLRARCASMPFVVAYGSHVDTEALRTAREAGCDIVWPRSKFVEELPNALTAWIGLGGTP